MQPLIAELDALVAKIDSKNASMTLPKILECVCNLINYLSTANKSEITQHFKNLQQILCSILPCNFGDATNEYLTARIIASLFIKVMAACEPSQNQALIGNIFNILLGSKYRINTKLITMATLNGILRNNKEVHNFPRGILQDMFQNLLKVCKTLHDIPIRLGAINCMRLLIKMKLAISTANTQEVMKLLLRYIAEKTEELKLCCARTLLSFLNHSPWSDSLQYYEQICTLCMRIIADNVAPDLKRQLTFVYTKVNIMKLIRGLEVQDKSKKQPKGAVQAPVENTDKITELIQSFNAMYSKEEALRHFLLEYLFLALIYFKKEIRSHHLNGLLNAMWNLFKKLPADSAPKNGKFFTQFMESFSVLLTQDLKFVFLSQVAETLKVKASQKAPGEEDSQKSNANNIKTNGTRAQQLLFILKLFIHLVESLGSLLREKFHHASNLFDALIPYLSYDNIEIQICAAYAINYLVDAYPRGRAQVLSRLLHLMTVSRGELAACQVPDPAHMNEPVYHLNTARGSSFAVSLIIRNIDFEMKSIPFDIINSVFESAKSILTDEMEDQNVRKLLFDDARYQALGWTIIGEVTSIEYHWVGSRIKILFDLWKNLFMTEEVQAASEDDFKRKLFERIYAFKSLRKFSCNCKKLQNEAILKVIGTFICNFTSLILTQLPKNPFNVTIKKTDSEIISAKLEVYKCVNAINPIYFPGKFNLILQTAIEDVANFLNEEIYFITKKLFPFVEYDIAYLLDFGPKFFKILYGLEDIYDFDEKEHTLFDYDFSENFFSKYLTNSRTDLVKEQLMFIGDAFNSPVFIHKNKMQLLKFLVSNIKACHTAKDPFIRIQKLFSLLIITLSIVNKISAELGKDEEVSLEILEIFKEICENSWSYVNNHARITCALIYAMLFKLSKSQDFHENLLKTLYDGLSDAVKAPTISVVVGCIFQFHSHMDQKLFIQLVNIFQKSSRNQDVTNAIWLINSLRLGLEHAPDYSRDLIKSCLPFLMRYHYENKNSGRVSFTAWCYLLEVLTKRINSLKIERMYHIDALVLDLDNTDFVIPDNFLKDAKLTLTTAVLNNSQLSEHIKLKYTKSLVKQLKSPRLAGKLPRLPKKAFELTQTIVESGDMEQINQFEKKFNNIYLNAINTACNKRDPNVEKVEKLYYKFLTIQLQLLKLKMSSFEDQLLFFKEYVFPEQENKDSESKEQETKPAAINSGKIEFNYDYSITLKTRVYALKCIDNLLQYTNVHTFKAKDVISFANLIIPFVFKAASSPFEEIKEMGMKIFHNIFSKLINYSETGEELSTMTEGEKVPLMLQYGAQIDALIRFNLKDINENSSASVQSSLKLYNKFFKLMYRDDVSMVKKLFSLVASGIQRPLRLTQSTYHSERALTEIHFSRARILCKVYQYFRENLDKEAVLREEFDNFFPKPLKKYLEQNLVAILEDSALVTMFSRRLLKSYENFHFIYNGTKISYDPKSVFSGLPIFLSTYFALVNENLDTNEIIRSTTEQETKKYLNSNVKSIPPKETSIHICLVLCNFFLAHIDTYENNSEALKRLKKLFDHQLYKTFKEKLIVLKGLQIILHEKNIVEENAEVFSETLSILNNYLSIGSPVLINEVFKVYQAIIVGHFSNWTFDVISTSLSMFWYYFQAEIQTNPDAWAETISLFFVILRLLVTGFVENFAESGQNSQVIAAHLFFFLNMPLSYLFTGLPRLQLEGLRALKQITQVLAAVGQGSDKKRALVEGSFEKFIMLILNRLNENVLPQDAKIRLIDLLISMEHILKDSFKHVKPLFEEATPVICKDSDLLRVYLVNLRTMWRTIKQINQDYVPKLLVFIKCALEQMHVNKTLTAQDNDLIAEIIKIFIYLQFESPSVNKIGFAEALLGVVIIAISLGVNANTTAVITQLMQHLYSNLPESQVKQMLSNVNPEQKAALCNIIPILQTIDAKKFDVPQAATGAHVGMDTIAKPVIKLLTFGKKK